ncbi:MAG: hypothetical protein ACE5JZ_00935 [Kiloniellales bacterium]
MAKTRDTYKYDFVKGGRIVHSGITRDPERREGELRRAYGSGNLRQVGRRTTEEAARSWEKGKRKA